MRSRPIPHIKVLGEKIVPTTDTVVQILAALAVDRAEASLAPVVCEHVAGDIACDR